MIKKLAEKIAGKRSDAFIEYCDSMKSAKFFRIGIGPGTTIDKEIIQLTKFYTLYKLYNLFLSKNILGELEECGIVYNNYIAFNTNGMFIYYNDGEYRVKVNSRSKPKISRCESGNQCQYKNTCVCGNIIGTTHKIQVCKVIIWLNKQLDDTYTKKEIIFLLYVMNEPNAFEDDKYITYDWNENRKDPVSEMYNNIKKKKDLKDFNKYKSKFYCKDCNDIALYNISGRVKQINVCYKHIFGYYKEPMNMFPTCLSKMIVDYIYG